MSWYLDSSAVLKLLIDEKESKPLVNFIDFVVKTSVLTRVEIIRTLKRIAPEKVSEGQEILNKMDIIPLSNGITSMAENFSSTVTLRSLDSLHVASVLFLNGSVEGLVTYDRQMISNAKALGINVIHPGMK